MTRQSRHRPLQDRLRRGRDHPAYREVHDAASLLALTDQDAPLTGWRLQGIDLAPHAEHLSRVDVHGMVVLGGHVPADLARDLTARGAVLIPEDPTCPVDPFRSRLYTAGDLYAGLESEGYEATVDARAYAWSRERHTRRDAYATLLRAMHDDAMHDALTELLHQRATVGVMGGHALERGGSDYTAAARLGRTLADAGLVVLTGGGPGAMEAANLGASAPGVAALDAAVDLLGTVPGFRPSVDAWARVGFAARRLLEEDGAKGAAPRSVGIPTWFYGHEPPNVFCDGIAKYFSNALREDVLLASSTHGLIVLPGAAGTVQEIFQAATPLYYHADEGRPPPPLVLVGLEHWTETLPVWPALRALGSGRPLGEATHLVATPEEAAAIVLAP